MIKSLLFVFIGCITILAILAIPYGIYGRFGYEKSRFYNEKVFNLLEFAFSKGLISTLAVESILLICVGFKVLNYLPTIL